MGIHCNNNTPNNFLAYSFCYHFES